MTYEGTRGSAIGQRDKGKHVLDIPSSSVEGRTSEWHEAVLLQGHRLLFSDQILMMLMLQSGSHTNIASHPAGPACPTALETGLELLQIPAWG